MVIIACDHEPAPLCNALALCEDMGYISLLVPQTVMTEPEHLLAKSLRDHQKYPDWIMEVPSALCGSAPRKKMLISARKGTSYERRSIHLLKAVTNDKADLSRLTVKTLWYCCRKELRNRISYQNKF